MKKRMVSICLSLIMLLSLAACQRQEQSSSAAESRSSTPSSEASHEPSEEAGSADGASSESIQSEVEPPEGEDDYEIPSEYIVSDDVPLVGTYTETISILVNEAPGTKTYSKGSSTIDASNAEKGYIMVKCTSQKRIKVQVVMGDKKYNYDLNNQGNYEAIPLQMGNGTYNVRIMENVDSNRYVQLFAQQISVTFANERVPFLAPNQYVSYDADSAAIKKAFDLCVNAKTDVEKLQAVYGWIIDHVTYDTQKASTVKAGYLPNVDDTVDTQKGICFDYASLLAAMLRSQGVPTKLVIGTVSPKDLNHAWNEVYLEGKGWVTVKTYFEGSAWERMDATFGAAKTDSIEQFIGDGSNYTTLRIY